MAPIIKVGDLCSVAGGKYDGKSGIVTSVGNATCRLRVDGTETGNLQKTALTRSSKKNGGPARSSSSSSIKVGDRCSVAGGKYDGKAGTVTSVGESTCRLKIGGTETGNLPKKALSVLGPTTPPRKPAVAQTSPDCISALPGTPPAPPPSSLTPKSTMAELKAFRGAHDIKGVALTGAGRTKTKIVAELLAATRGSGTPVAAPAADTARAMCISSPLELESTTRDCEMVAGALRRKGFSVEPLLITDPRGGTGRVAVLKKLKTFLSQKASLFVLYYSGHGDEGEAGAALGGKNGGGLVVGHGGPRGIVDFGDIVQTWDEARGRRRGLKLVVVADSCFSGKLVSKLRRLPRGEQEGLNLAVQSAGNARQTVLETGAGDPGARHGGKEWEAGAFTCYWALKQAEAVRWTLKAQHPQFYASWDRSSGEKSRYEIPCGGGGASLVMYSQPDHR